MQKASSVSALGGSGVTISGLLGGYGAQVLHQAPTDIWRRRGAFIAENGGSSGSPLGFYRCHPVQYSLCVLHGHQRGLGNSLFLLSGSKSPDAPPGLFWFHPQRAGEGYLPTARWVKAPQTISMDSACSGVAVITTGKGVCVCEGPFIIAQWHESASFPWPQLIQPELGWCWGIPLQPHQGRNLDTCSAFADRTSFPWCLSRVNHLLCKRSLSAQARLPLSSSFLFSQGCSALHPLAFPTWLPQLPAWDPLAKRKPRKLTDVSTPRLYAPQPACLLPTQQCLHICFIYNVHSFQLLLAGKTGKSVSTPSSWKQKSSLMSSQIITQSERDFLS